MIQCHNISVSFGANSVLDDVSFGIEAGDVVALVGANGAGKSTLLKCLMGEMNPEHGQVIREAHTQVAYLPQEMSEVFEGTVFERMMSFDSELFALYQKIECGNYDVIPEYSALGGYAREDMIRNVAENFGVSGELDREYKVLSQGMLRKVDLAGMFWTKAECLIFDEPINYLDIRGITAFEEGVLWAKRSGRAVLIVSHDRELIDQVADYTLVLERGHVIKVQGGYSAALAHQKQVFDAQVEKAQDLNKKIGALQLAMRRRMGWGVQREKETTDSASRRLAAKVMKGAKVMERRMEKQKAVLEAEKPWIEKPVALHFPTYDVARQSVVRVENVQKRYGDVVVLDDVTLSLDTLDRVTIMGANGAGKTSLLKVLTGRLAPDAGDVYVNGSADIGYVTQGLDGFYFEEIFLNNFLETGYTESVVRQFLGAAKLRRDQVLQPVETLSYGERMRGAIVRLMLNGVSFMVLDEPTTHLDIESVDVLELLLGEFCGGFILVSHDRHFVSQVSQQIYMLEDGRLRQL